jgi:uncharacterized membrane protein YagU involved in acid resistance
MQQRSALWAILVGGAVAGTLDILYAITYWSFNGLTAERVLQSIASGVFGKEAYLGGLGLAGFGLAMHFLMSFAYAAAFVLASQRLPVLQRRPALCGIVFGIGVFFFMRHVVLPLSAFPHPVVFRPLGSSLDLMSHMFLFGLPIALACSKVVKHAHPARP